MSESQTPILYHYLASPYSEKLRLALGVTGIQWGSVIVPAQPPRPSLDIFLSGYRRIPVLQIGAHFYCDSALAFDALAGVSDRLKPAGPLSKADELLRRHAEDRIFFAVIAAASPISVLRLLAQDLGLFGLFRFLKDRSDMMKGSTVEKLSQRAAARLVEDFVMQLNGLLKQDQFLGGAHAGYLDLCCYHPLWMASVINRETLSALPPMVQAWMRRIAALGHGRSVLVSERQIYDRVTGDRFQVKRITVRPGAALSLQNHYYRSEHWIVVEGIAKVTINDSEQIVGENQSVYIPLGAIHRMENPGKLPLVIIEVQTGSYLGEDDIVRHEDDYARE